MPLDAYDQVMAEMLEEMGELLDAGLDSRRLGDQEFSTEEQFITMALHLHYLARSRPDTQQKERVVNGRKRVVSMRDLTFEEEQPRHEKRKAAREARKQGSAPAR